VREFRDRRANDVLVEQGDRGSGGSDRCASTVTIAEAAALMRLSVGSVIVTGLVDGVVNRHPMTARRISVSAFGLLDSEAAMHFAGVQLPRLDHTDGEPDRKHAGESFNDPISTHASNIW
jgi:hypothetical protein